MIEVLKGFVIIFLAGFKEWYNFKIEWTEGLYLKLGDICVAVLCFGFIIIMLLKSLGFEKEWYNE